MDLLCWPLLLTTAALLARCWRRRAAPDPQRRVLLALTGLCLLAAVLLRPEPWLLRKILGNLLMPLGGLWLACALWAATRPSLRRALLPAGCCLALGALGSPLLASWSLASLEAPYRAAAIDDPHGLEALVILGGGTGAGADGRGQLGAAGDRLRRGAALHRAGRAPLLVVTGASIPGVGALQARNLAAEASHVLEQWGVATAAIIRIEQPRSTDEEADALRALVAERGWRRWGLCTSAWHLERALGLLRRRGLDPVPVAADVRGEPVPWNSLALIPTGGDAQDLHRALWEWQGRLLVR